jgi:hypothetical protein
MQSRGLSRPKSDDDGGPVSDDDRQVVPGEAEDSTADGGIPGHDAANGGEGLTPVRVSPL